jgi:hypothetical protein
LAHPSFATFVEVDYSRHHGLRLAAENEKSADGMGCRGNRYESGIIPFPGPVSGRPMEICEGSLDSSSGE